MKYISIAELGRVVTGKTPPTNHSEYFGGEIPFITPSDIETYDKRYVEYTERTLTTQGASSIKGCLLPPKSICFVCIGSTIGKSCMTKCVSYTNQQINSIIPNQSCIGDYLFYLLKYIKGYFQSVGGGTGAGKGIVNKTLFQKTKVEIHNDLNVQQRIASILTAYDDLIENNNRRIKILEQMAENLYKEWFIRFRFPGYESSSFVASSIGRIPEGFSVLKMQDVIDYHIGGGWGSDVRDKNFECDAFVIRGTDFPYVKEGILSTCPRRYHKINNYRTRKLEEGDIILEVSGGTAEQPVGRALLVTKDTLRRFGRKLICASFCKLVRLKRNIISPYYFIYWMNFLYSTRIIEKFQLQSTGIINFKFEYFFKKGDILLPPVDLMHIFVGKIKTIKAQIDKLAEVNENLTKQRDMLLPRLMSGKQEV